MKTIKTISIMTATVLAAPVAIHLYSGDGFAAILFFEAILMWFIRDSLVELFHWMNTLGNPKAQASRVTYNAKVSKKAARDLKSEQHNKLKEINAELKDLYEELDYYKSNAYCENEYEYDKRTALGEAIWSLKYDKKALKEILFTK